MPPSALSGVRVLDLSDGIAGPFAARLLGDFGADVVKVEPPQGDSARALPPFFDAAAPAERSLLFRYLNWNKRGVALDVSTAAGRAALATLVSEADIVITGSPTDPLLQGGPSAEQMLAAHPTLVVTSIADFGLHGPYSGYRGSDLVHQAMSGIMQISGDADRPPLKHGAIQSSWRALSPRRRARCLRSPTQQRITGFRQTRPRFWRPRGRLGRAQLVEPPL